MKILLSLFIGLSFISASYCTDVVDTVPYLRYIANISQTGTNPPTENRVFENTIGAHVWERYDEGIYVITFTGTSFAKNQIWLYVTYLPDADPNNLDSVIGIEWGPYLSSIRLNTKGDRGFDDACIEIRIYPPVQ